MTTAAGPCPECGHALTSDDRFCSRCGAATPANTDPDATIIVARRDSTPRASGQPSPRLSAAGTTFTSRLRDVLEDEYEIMSLLGQGGFARVYKARDLRLDRTVAIKVVRPDVADAGRFAETFRTEGIALAQLRHPGIIPIYDLREREGLIYYVMPFISGTTLEARLKRGRLPPFEARRILSELADALSATHRANMIHLDIKPANIFLEGSHQKVLLTDFGAAKAVPKEVPDASDEMVVGTPTYMSPEQARGLPEIDHRSDIYSLGVLGYHMLMGRPPFTGRNAREVLEKHVSKAPVPIRDIHPTIPKELADSVMRCLAKDPWERFSTTAELTEALDKVTFFSGKRETAPQEVPAAMEPKIVAAVAGMALLVGLLVGLAIG